MLFFKKLFLDLIYFLFKVIGLILPKKNRKISLNGEENILILSFFFIGDCLFLTPVYRELKRKFPKINITVAVNKISCKKVLENNPNIDKVILLNNYSSGLKYIIKNISKRYDLIIDYSAIFYWSLLFRFIKSDFRLARQNKQIIGHFLVENFDWLSDKIINYNNGYIVDYYLGLIEFLGIKAEERKMEIFLSKEETENVIEKYEFGRKKYLVFHIGANVPENIWHNWEELINYVLGASKEFFIVLTGIEDDKLLEQKILKKINNKYKDKVISLVGKTDLRELAVIIKNCSLYVGGDTGSTHIAITLNKKVIILFGRADYKLYSPISEKIIRMYSEINCYPCYTYGNIYCNCPYKRSLCLDSLDPYKVFKKVELLLRK